MTNFEKYKDEILKITETNSPIALKNNKPCNCKGRFCQDCDFNMNHCIVDSIRWLYEEYKEPAPKLTAKERAFCEAIDFPHDKYIGRTHVGNLSIGMKYKTLMALDNTWFKFIKSGSEWNVVDLLKLEVE